MTQRFGVDVRVLPTLDVDEIALLFVGYLRREIAVSRHPNAGNAMNDASIEARENGLSQQHADEVVAAVARGWQWLRNHLMLAPHPSQSSAFEMLTPSADSLDVPGYLLEIRADDLLGGLVLDPDLTTDAMPSFRRGAYSTAVLAAYRRVEHRVRQTAGLGRGVTGRDVMFAAFNPGGPLADPALETSENQGRAQLFAGAIMAIRNEQGHHVVDIDDPQEAAELILFANLLLRILEQDADLVMFLWREKERGGEDEDPEGEVINLRLAKHRNGPTGDTKLYFKKKQTRFVSYATEDKNYAGYYSPANGSH